MSDVAKPANEAAVTQPAAEEQKTNAVEESTPTATESTPAEAPSSTEPAVVTGGTDDTPIPDHTTGTKAAVEDSVVSVNKTEPSTKSTTTETKSETPAEAKAEDKTSASTAKAEVKPITEGILGYKAPGLVK